MIYLLSSLRDYYASISGKTTKSPSSGHTLQGRDCLLQGDVNLTRGYTTHLCTYVIGQLHWGAKKLVPISQGLKVDFAIRLDSVFCHLLAQHASK